MPKESYENIASFIPQVFYDVIGRIIPGSILLTLSYLIFHGQSIEQTKQGYIETVIFTQPQSLLIFEFIVFSYFISTLFGGIWMFVSRKDVKDIKDLKFESIQTMMKQPDHNHLRISFLYDAIQHEFPSVGSRLAKLSAERHLARVLTIGLSILFFAYIFTHYPLWKTLQFYLISGALISSAVLSYIFNLHIEDRSSYLMVNHWHFLPEEVRNCIQQNKEKDVISEDNGKKHNQEN